MPSARWPGLALLLGLLASSPALAQLDVPPEPPLPPPPTGQQPPQEQRPPQQQPTPSPTPATPPPSQASPAPAPLAPPPAAGAPAPPEDRYHSTVTTYRPSPTWTQDRSFTSTRFWLLDPGRYEVQTWWRTRLYDDPKANPYEFLFQQEVEIGVAPHLQIDVYENLQLVDDGSGGGHQLQQEGLQLEARIAIPSYYGQMFGNPVVYLEFHPRHNAPDRAEVRLLLGGAPTSWLYLVMNPYVESNVETTDTYTVVNGQLSKSSPFIADAEFGSTFAAGVRITDWFRVSAEAKIGWDMLGTTNNALHFVAWAGPGFILKPFKGSNYFKIMGTCLFGLTGMTNSDGAAAQRYEPLLIVGSAF